MLRIQLDDRALFLARWQKLLLELLTPEATAGKPRRAEARSLVEGWGGRARVDSVGYRIVRAFRLRVAADAFAPLVAPVPRRGPEVRLPRHAREPRPSAVGGAALGARHASARAPARPALRELGRAAARARSTRSSTS